MGGDRQRRGVRGGVRQQRKRREQTHRPPPRQAAEAPITAFRVDRAPQTPAASFSPSGVWPPSTPYFSAPRPIGAAASTTPPAYGAPGTPPGYGAPGTPPGYGAPGTPPGAPGTPGASFRQPGTPLGFGDATPPRGSFPPTPPGRSAGPTPPLHSAAVTPPAHDEELHSPQDHEDHTETLPAPLREENADAAYFEAYDHMEVHALMLKDSQRVGSYLAAIRAHHLKGKRVLDVGAGSGILSLLCAKHGLAEHVWAVEAVPGMAKLASQLVEHNGLQDKVTVLNSKVEDVQLPGKVDVIISEWMGFYLVHESMLESVLLARDRFLQPKGLLLPGSARIWAALVESEELRKEIASYDDFLGLDLHLVGEQQLVSRLAEPQVEEVNPRRLLAEPILAMDLGDLLHMPVEGTRELQAQLCFRTWRRGYAAGIAFWFDVNFGHEVVLKTDPGSPPTHWKQTVVYLGSFPEVEAGDVLEASVTMQQSHDNPRQYHISIETS